jgi:hypothetical protein
MGKETDAHVEIKKHIFAIFQFKRDKSQEHRFLQTVQIKSSHFTCLLLDNSYIFPDDTIFYRVVP